jgi:hypothetical protein
MGLTKRQKKNMQFADLCDSIAKGVSQGGKELRAIVRRAEMHKGQTKPK